MNAYEYLQALRAALNVLPDEEIDSAIQYYQDYFLDAGDENAARVIQELGPPEQVAQAILNDYTGMARRRPPQSDTKQQEEPAMEGVPLGSNGKPLSGKLGIRPWVLVVLILIGLPIGLPLLFALVATVFAIVIGVAALIAGIGLLVVLLPIVGILSGVVITIISFCLWAAPASALATLGFGLILFAIGVFATLLVFKLGMICIPPIVRGCVNLARRLLDKICRLINRGVKR